MMVQDALTQRLGVERTAQTSPHRGDQPSTPLLLLLLLLLLL
jgi:hypothetical protein